LLEDPAPAQRPLFRHEAVQALGPRLVGDIVLMPGRGSGWMALLALALLAGLVALLFLGRYTQRVTVTGQLLPSQGLMRIVAPQAGVIVERLVHEGQAVTQGQVLFVVDSDLLASPAASAPLQSQLASQVQARRGSLQAERERSLSDERDDQAALQRRLQALRAELAQTRRQADEQGQRLAQAQDTVHRYQSLLAQGFVSRDAMLAKQADAADQQAQARELAREALELERLVADTAREQDASRARYQNQRAAVDRELLTNAQSQAEVQSQRQVAVRAPQAGLVALLQGERGQAVDGRSVLAHVTPSDALLVAKLYAPSRAVGVAQAGDRVLIRYDAFAFQRYGQHEGRIVSIARSAAGAEELDAPARNAAEPLYAVHVALPAQHIGQGAAQRPLQSGMRLEADLFQESRRIIEWIVEPLAALPRKVAGQP
jgi:membrane fusion protein